MTDSLARTPLHALHLSLGARMAGFAGYDMAVSYPAGVLAEHLNTREAASLFDVSHMGQIGVRPRSGRIEDAGAALEALLPMDVLGLAAGRQRYGFLTGAEGGILDDVMVANRGDHLLLVVNAGRKGFDLAHLEAGLGGTYTLEVPERGLLALQGPRAGAALAALAPEVAAMRFMDVREVDLDGVAAVVSRSGYTGEDGFEIGVAAEQAAALAERLLALEGVGPAGLGARDALRLEAGLCLWGADIDETTTPVEAALEWAIGPARRTGGERAGGFPGDAAILRQIAEGASRRRVGLLPEGRAPMRAGTPLHAPEMDTAVGRITSGGFGPSLGAPVAMGYVPIALAAPGTRLEGMLRGTRRPATVARLPFIAPGRSRLGGRT